VEAAARGFRDWGTRSAQERAGVLVAAAQALRARRAELAALAVRECAKPWREADADVCEAIDFLEYYARGAIELDHGRPLMQVPGERNSMRYAPRGVAAVISPWNFPLAIPAGMTAAALAAGNAVVLKPAEQSPGCSLALVEALHGAGVPADALALLPGFGEAGAALVRHPGVHVIAFTGSSAVGLDIVRAAAETPEGQPHLKQVVAEMGGKNCVIVDSDADLDEAVPAIVGSAFAYAGQKCSAAARVLAHEAVYEPLVERLAGAVKVLAVGQAESFATEVPPVIEREARERVEGYAAAAAASGRIAARAGRPEGGWFCAPALACDLDSAAPLLREEVFGPLLTVEPVPGIEAACDVVDSLPFALTGGLLSRSPATVEAVARRLPVGNLYVNRGITGAMVGRQPFGGNRLSGEHRAPRTRRGLTGSRKEKERHPCRSSGASLKLVAASMPPCASPPPAASVPPLAGLVSDGHGKVDDGCLFVHAPQSSDDPARGLGADNDRVVLEAQLFCLQLATQDEAQIGGGFHRGAPWCSGRR
jgi:RHH-type proline utilization regulon transcriptional repressor/proline dehydrogenase/delta 1-pyrroline-5-carboxylate dehydrogenase